MYSLQEVYGQDYHRQVHQARIDHIINTLVNNIAHREFSFRFDDCGLLWNREHIENKHIDEICQKVAKLNQQLIIRHIDMDDPQQKKILPYIIQDAAVEYFYIIDKEFEKCYLIFITPTQLGAF